MTLKGVEPPQTAKIPLYFLQVASGSTSLRVSKAAQLPGVGAVVGGALQRLTGGLIGFQCHS